MEARLLLFLLGSRANVLLERAVGDLEAAKSADANIQNGKKENDNNETHEDAYWCC